MAWLTREAHMLTSPTLPLTSLHLPLTSPALPSCHLPHLPLISTAPLACLPAHPQMLMASGALPLTLPLGALLPGQGMLPGSPLGSLAPGTGLSFLPQEFTHLFASQLAPSPASVAFSAAAAMGAAPGQGLGPGQHGAAGVGQGLEQRAAGHASAQNAHQQQQQQHVHLGVQAAWGGTAPPFLAGAGTPAVQQHQRRTAWDAQAGGEHLSSAGAAGAGARVPLVTPASLDAASTLASLRYDLVRGYRP